MTGCGTSNSGPTTTAGVDTGKVMDCQASGKYCHSCELNKGKYKNSSSYKDTSGAMEVSGTVDMFSRSTEKHGLRYTSCIGDGDSHAFKAVTEHHPHSRETKTVKLECTGHMYKRISGQLGRLKT